MAYIKSEQVKEMRNKIKELFPSKNGWKFSIVRLDYSCLSVKILRAPVDLAYNKAEGNKHFNVNHYHLDRYEKDEVREVFEKITNICTVLKTCRLVRLKLELALPLNHLLNRPLS